MFITAITRGGQGLNITYFNYINEQYNTIPDIIGTAVLKLKKDQLIGNEQSFKLSWSNGTLGGKVSINYDRCIITVRIPQSVNVTNTGGGIINQDGSGNTFITWDIISIDKRIKPFFSQGEFTFSLIKPSYDIDIEAAMALLLGPLQGPPDSNYSSLYDCPFIYNWQKWNVDPQSVYWVVVGHSSVTATVEGNGPAFYQDDFEDGVIDPDLWVVGGQNRAVDGCGFCGGQWFNEEIVGEDGYLQARVTCPGSGPTIGSDSWIRTVHDFNDGNDWIINFRWETDIQTVGQWHADYHLIEITKGRTDWGGCYYHPPLSQVLPRKQQLFYSNGQDFGPTTWSIVINASASEATLFEGPNGTGVIHSTKELDNGVTWYVRFITSTATSGGFPAKDCRLNLYDFTATRN